MNEVEIEVDRWMAEDQRTMKRKISKKMFIGYFGVFRILNVGHEQPKVVKRRRKERRKCSP